MGLIKRSDGDGLFSPYIENYNNNQLNEHLFPSSDEYDSDSQSVESQQARFIPLHRGTRHRISVSQENLASGRRRGVRRARRVDNLRYLMNLEEKDEDTDDAAAMASFEPCSSLFEELLTHPDKMEMWNSFVESSEEEQLRILNYRGLHDIKEEEEEGDENLLNANAHEKTAEENWVIILDKRSDNPAYSPKECYGRVDRNLRTLLKRRQLPMGMLANLEREVISFFCDCPSSVFICDIGSSYERMLLHALCQYLNLHSRSYNDGESRKTQVENKMVNFRPPTLLLSEYLQQNQHSL